MLFRSDENLDTDAYSYTISDMTSKACIAVGDGDDIEKAVNDVCEDFFDTHSFDDMQAEYRMMLSQYRNDVARAINRR